MSIEKYFKDNQSEIMNIGQMLAGAVYLTTMVNDAPKSASMLALSGHSLLDAAYSAKKIENLIDRPLSREIKTINDGIQFYFDIRHAINMIPLHARHGLNQVNFVTSIVKNFPVIRAADTSPVR